MARDFHRWICCYTCLPHLAKRAESMYVYRENGKFIFVRYEVDSTEKHLDEHNNAWWLRKLCRHKSKGFEGKNVET